MKIMRHKINEGDYTEWLLNQQDYEHELWNTDPEVREFDRQQRAYEQKIRKNKRRRKPTSFRTVRLKECDKYAIADNGYIFVQWGGKCNILTPQKDVIYDTWFDSIQFFKDYTPTSPIEVRHNNKWNFLIPEENRILSDVWFGKVWPFEGGWAEVFIKPNDKEYLWLNMDGEIFHDDGTPYQPTAPEPINNNNPTNESRNINKKNTIRLTESELKKVITESVKTIIQESIARVINEGKESTASANRMIKILYKGVNDLTSHIYRDNDWRYINNVFKRIEDIVNPEGELSVWCENVGYVKDKEGTPMYKEWKLRIELNNGGLIGGSVKANAAGSIEDPLDAYDITCTFWRE